MSNFGGLFGVFIIIVVTLAQLAGNSKRNKNKSGKRAEKTAPGMIWICSEDPRIILVELREKTV